ncbi:MAG: sugar phosphate isomerase/epimerase family protein [Candidatus Thermoplasmatota archaeon]
MFAISIPEYCLRPFHEVLEEFAPHFRAWEVVAEVEHDMEKVWRAMNQVREQGRMAFQVHAPFSDLNVASLNETMRLHAVAYLRRALDLAVRAGVEIVTVHPGVISPIGAYARERMLRKAVESLRELAIHADNIGIPICVENMPHGRWALMSTASEAERICEETGLGLCYDVGHAHLAGQEREFLALADRFVNLHLHDNDRSWDQHLTVGKGGADFKALLGVLGNYRGRIVIEARSLESALESVKRLRVLGYG